MSFDPILMAQINRLTKGGGVGCTSTTECEILAETVAEFNDGDGIHAAATTQIVAGSQYTVRWDVKAYFCTCKVVSFVAGDSEVEATILGNTGAFEEEFEYTDHGEPFVIIVDDNGYNLNIVPLDGNDHTVSILGRVRTTVCLPVVESGLTLELNTEYALPETLTATLDAAAESKTPIVFGFIYKEIEFLVPMCYARTREYPGWQGQALCDAVIAALIERKDAGWMCMAMALMAF